jgi:hypothetical protein
MVQILKKKISYLAIGILIIAPITGITFGQTILDFVVTPIFFSVTESTSVVAPTSQLTIPDPVIVNGTTNSTVTNATESEVVVTPASFAQTSTVSPITKTIFTSEGTSFVPQPEPVIVSSVITESNFTSTGTSFIPERDPVITTTVITKSTFQSVGAITLVQPSHNFCDPIPVSGDWNVQSSCILSINSTINGNVIVQNGVILEIPSDVILNIDFTNFKLTVKSGGGVLIKAGGAIT